MLSYKHKHLYVLISAAFIAGCGNGNNTSASNPPQAGQPYTTAVLVDGVPVQQSNYRVYSVADDNGTLSDQPLADKTAEEARPHLLLKESTQVLATGGTLSTSGSVIPAGSTIFPAISFQEVQTCYSKLWTQIKEIYPDATQQELAQRISSNFSMPIDDLCYSAGTAGLTLPQYIELFMTVKKYYPNSSNIAASIVQFFQNLEVSPVHFKIALQANGYTWDDFLKRLSSSTNGVIDFQNAYASSPLNIEAFLQDYMSQPNPLVAKASGKLKLLAAHMSKSLTPKAVATLSPTRVLAQASDSTVKDYTDATKEIADAANSVFNIGKSVWVFLKENKAIFSDKTSGESKSAILAKSDNESLNYGFAKSSSSPKVTFIGKTLGLIEDYRVEFQLDADYDAQNPNAPGHWLPDIRIVTNNVKVGWGYNVDGTAKLYNPVNRGAVIEPVPEVRVVVTMTASSFSVTQQSFNFIANGLTGATIPK